MPTTHEQSDSLLLFRVGPIACAVPATTVDGIIQPPTLNHLPGSDPGVFARAHQVSSVIDLRRRFGLPAGTPSAGRLLLSHQGRSRYGYWVDEVIGLEQQHNVTLRPLPDYLPRNVFDAIMLHNQGLVLVSDLTRLARLRGEGFVATHLEKITPPEKTPAVSTSEGTPRQYPPVEKARPAPVPAAPASNIEIGAPRPAAGAAPRPVRRQGAVTAHAGQAGIPSANAATPRPPVSAMPRAIPAPTTTATAYLKPGSPGHAAPVSAPPVPPTRRRSGPVPAPLAVANNADSGAPLWLAIAAALVAALLLLGWLLWPLTQTSSPVLPAQRAIPPRTQAPLENSGENIVPTIPHGGGMRAPAPAPASYGTTATQEGMSAPPPQPPPVVEGGDSFTAQVEQQHEDIHIIIERSILVRGKVPSVPPATIDRETLHADESSTAPMTEEGIESSRPPFAPPSTLQPLPTAGSCSLVVHTVVPGDTLWAIAERYVDNAWLYPELARLSNITNPHRIYPGQKVYIEFR